MLINLIHYLHCYFQTAFRESNLSGEPSNVPWPQQPPKPLVVREHDQLRDPGGLRRADRPLQPQPHFQPLQL